MATFRYVIPTAQEPVIDKNTGTFTKAWYNFLADISSRVAANVDDLGASPTVEQIATAFNGLKDELIASSQMEPD